MRLTCPNCGATYALAAETLPQGGSHVQCGACHTRWFFRPDRPVPVDLSEDQIVARLEGRGSRAVTTGDNDAPKAEPPGAAPIAFPGPSRPRPPASQPTAPLQDATVGGAVGTAAGPGPTPLRPRPSAERAAPEPSLSPVAATPAPAAAPGRRALGAVAALTIAALGLAAYIQADALAARLPVATAALATYAEAVDAGRDWIEARLGPARDRLLGG